MSSVNTGRTRNIASQINAPQGGGNKKAGLPGTFGNKAWTTIHLRNTSQNYSVLKMPFVSTNTISRPIGMSVMNTREFKL